MGALDDSPMQVGKVMKFGAPTKIAWFVALALAILSLLSILFTIPFINNNILFALVPLAGCVVLLVATALPKI